MTRPKVLFVDDEPVLRQTIPLILEQQGFDVIAAADVTSALELITTQAFDVLLSDLNMGELSDGFTVVSAMRRLQPNCRTLILTGYPDFQGALDRLLGQADGYILKPTRPGVLAERIREQLAAPGAKVPGLHKNLADLLAVCRQSVLERWRERCKRDPGLSGGRMTEAEHMDEVPDVLDEVISALRTQREAAQNESDVRSRSLKAARQHGVKRREQGFSLEQLFKELRVLQSCIFELAQEHLLDLDVSAIIPELTVASDTIEVLVATSIRAYVDAPRRAVETSV